MINQEPIYRDIKDSRDIRLALMFNWYNETFNYDDAVSHLRQYMRSNKCSSEELCLLDTRPTWATPLHIGALSRLLTSGVVLPKELEGKVKDHIKSLSSWKQPRNLSSKVTSEKLTHIIGDIETLLDKFFRNGYQFFSPGVFDLLKKHEAKQYQANSALSFYEDLKEELENITPTTEGYTLKKKQLENYRNFVDSICSDIRRYVNAAKATAPIRKPRKKKAKTALQQIKKVSYQRTFRDEDGFEINSIDPINIVGAKSVWLYNTKTRKLTNLLTSNPKGLAVKGTTILNYDEDSETRTLRKPQETIQAVMSAGKVTLRTILKNLTTKPSPTTGRLGKDTVILRALK